MKPILNILLVLLLVPILGTGQTTTITRYGELKSSNQDIWGSGGGFSLNIDKDIFRLKWDKSGKSGSIKSLGGYDFGGELMASTWGNIGSNFVLKGFTSGLASVYYPFNVEYTLPDSGTFNVGDQVTITSKYDVLSNASLKITNPSAGIAELRMQVGFGFDVNSKLCLFGCKNFHIIPDIELPVQDFYLLHLDSSGLVCPCSQANYICSDYDDPSTCTKLLYNLPTPGFCRIKTFPLKIPVAGGAITGQFNMPYYDLVNTSVLRGKNLYASGEYNYLTLTTDVFKTLSLLPIPIVSTVLGNLSNDYSIAGYGKFSYNIFDMDFPIKNYHKHEFAFEPTLYNKIRLSTKVNYEVVDASGNQITSGKDSIINYPLESDVKIKIPCNSEFVDVLNYDYDIASTKNFSNHTYDSLSFEIAMSALNFSITLPEVVIFPKICFPEICVTLPYPCMKSKKKWGVKIYYPGVCTKRVCTPAYCTPELSFDGFYFGVGPLWEYNEQLGATSYDWYKNQWEFGGFSPYIDTNRIFRLYPTAYTVELNKTDVLCYGASTAKVNATILGGTKPYFVEWSNGSTTSINTNQVSIDNVPAGSYYVKITDANGCQIFSAAEVEQPELPLATEFVSIEDVKCFGKSTGKLDLAATGGTAPYTFSWTSDNTSFSSNNEDISGLQKGQYYIEVTDKNACKTYDTASITQPATSLSNTMDIGNVLCYGDKTGKASALAQGGTPPYTYLWSTSDTLKALQNVAAGTYYLEIKDINNCILEDTANIGQPLQPLSLAISAKNAQCFESNDGSIDLSVNGGTRPYRFSWTNQDHLILTQSTEDLSGLAAGTYQATVTDENGCLDTISANISQPTEIITSLSKSDVNCYAGNDGSIALKVSGGQAPYTFNWSNNAQSQNLSNLQAGFYEVEVSDNSKCKVIDSISIDQPNAPLSPTIASENVACYGESTGKIELTLSGGTSPYSYNWSNGSLGSTLKDIPAGTYTVTITDANGCLSYSGKQITEPDAPLSFTTQIKEPSCNEYANGFIEITPAGGTAPYYYKWDDTLYVINNETEILDQLPKGTYNIRIQDENECKAQQSFTLLDPGKIEIQHFVKTVSCFEGHDGAIDITVSGGTQPYKFNWSQGSTTEDVTNLYAGKYLVLVSDAQDCELSKEMEVDQFSKILIDAEISEISCSDQSDGRILLNVSGGAGTYSYLWSSGETTKDIYNKESGIYSVVVTDQNNCPETSQEFEIEFNESLCLNIPSSFTPNNDGTNDTWILRNIDLYENAVVKVFNRWGNLVFESRGNYVPWNGSFKGKDLPAATYYYVIDLQNEEQPYTGNVTIVR